MSSDVPQSSASSESYEIPACLRMARRVPFATSL
jgi:hypothetical protein